MFNPSREQVRQFFFDAWKKYRAGAPLEGLETVAVEVYSAPSLLNVTESLLAVMRGTVTVLVLLLIL